MASIQKMFNEEIRRLAKKEAKAATEPLRILIGNLRKQVYQQKETIKKMQNGGVAPGKDDSIDDDMESKETKFRMPSARIRKIRLKCGLTQFQMAHLLGVSHTSIVNWEVGKSSPRKETKASIAALAKLGKREIQKRLEESANAASSENEEN